MRHNTEDYLRPCKVDGKKAIFHRWVDKEILIIHFNALMNAKELDEIKKLYDEHQFISDYLKTTTIKDLVALVEFEDGAVKEVKADSVVFLDSKDKFREYMAFEDDYTGPSICCETCYYNKLRINPCCVCLTNSKWRPKEG